MTETNANATPTAKPAAKAAKAAPKKAQPKMAKAVKKTTAKKTVAKKAPAKTAAAKTVTAKKTVAKKSPAKKSPAKKASAKTVAAKTPKTPKTAKPAAKPQPSVAQAAPKTETSFKMNQTIENMTAASNDALKEGFEKSINAVNEASAFHKDTVDAVIESASVAGRSLEELNANSVAYAKTAMEEGVAVTKAVSSARSVQEVLEIQTDYAKSSMDAYLAELNKTSELFAGLVKETVKPLNDRFSAAVDLAQSQR